MRDIFVLCASAGRKRVHRNFSTFRGAQVSVSCCALADQVYGLDGEGRSWCCLQLISEPVLFVCMSGSREQKRVGRSVSRPWLYNFRRLSTLGGGAFGMNYIRPGGRAQGIFPPFAYSPFTFHGISWVGRKGCRRLLLSRRWRF